MFLQSLPITVIMSCFTVVASLCCRWQWRCSCYVCAAGDNNCGTRVPLHVLAAPQAGARAKTPAVVQCGPVEHHRWDAAVATAQQYSNTANWRLKRNFFIPILNPKTVYGFLVCPTLATYPHFLTLNYYMNTSSHAFTALKIQIDIFWGLKPFTHVTYHGRFGGNAASVFKVERKVSKLALDTSSLSLHNESVRSSETPL